MATDSNGRKPRNPNLRPMWQPGESGNPSGRPKGSAYDRIVRKVLGKLDERTLAGKPLPRGVTLEDLIADQWIKHALFGKSAYMSMLLDRLNGPVSLFGSPSEEADVRAALLLAQSLARVRAAQAAEGEPDGADPAEGEPDAGR